MPNTPIDKLLDLTRNRLHGANLSKVARVSRVSRQHLHRIRAGKSSNLQIDTLVSINMALDRIEEDATNG